MANDSLIIHIITDKHYYFYHISFKLKYGKYRAKLKLVRTKPKSNTKVEFRTKLTKLSINC